MLFDDLNVKISFEIQKKTLLFFSKCGRCEFLARDLYVYRELAASVLEDKENIINWKKWYFKYILKAVDLDYHLNKKHNKAKLEKQPWCTMCNFGRISQLECEEDAVTSYTHQIEWY